MADHKPLYRWSLQDAVTHNEVQDWRDSYRENCDCARAIERAIADQYHDNILENGTKDIIDRYGFDRVNWVLANTLQEKAHDGRFSQDNKRWAKGFFIPSDDVRWHFCVESHPGLTDLFINQTREAWQKLGLFDASHCSEDNDYAGKLLILKPSVLKDEFKASDYQLFYAESGFGCSPTASGRKVFGKFLKDGENTSFNRSDFLGVIKDECIPEWAAEKLAELNPLGDPEISALVYDVFCLLHSYDWAESGDTDMDAYQKDVEIFKSRWFKKARKDRIKEMIDISTEKLKEDLYQAFGFETESSSEP